MRCPKCKKSMRVDINNEKYICDEECGYQIIWITAIKQNGSERIYA